MFIMNRNFSQNLLVGLKEGRASVRSVLLSQSLDWGCFIIWSLLLVLKDKFKMLWVSLELHMRGSLPVGTSGLLTTVELFFILGTFTLISCCISEMGN